MFQFASFWRTRANPASLLRFLSFQGDMRPKERRKGGVLLYSVEVVWATQWQNDAQLGQIEELRLNIVARGQKVVVMMGNATVHDQWSLICHCHTYDRHTGGIWMPHLQRKSIMGNIMDALPQATSNAMYCPIEMQCMKSWHMLDEAWASEDVVGRASATQCQYLCVMFRQRWQNNVVQHVPLLQWEKMCVLSLNSHC